MAMFRGVGWSGFNKTKRGSALPRSYHRLSNLYHRPKPLTPYVIDLDVFIYLIDIVKNVIT
jgi:hypothetical protein